MTFDNFSYTKICIDDVYEIKPLKDNVFEVRSGSLSNFDYEKIISYEDDVDGREQNFLSVMKKKFTFNVSSGLLFPAVRYNFPGLLVFERPPTNKMVEYIGVPVDRINEDSLQNDISAYNLPLPWQLYVAQYDPDTMLLNQVSMYFMKESLKDSDQILYLPPLPNFYADGTLCRPLLAKLEDIERYSKDLSGIMVSAYDWVWNSGFNHDLMEGPLTVYQHQKNSFYDPKHVRTPVSHSSHRHVHPKDVMKILSSWEKYTLDNILTVDWPNPSVCHLWDAEVEWFFENYQAYPFDDHCEEYEDRESYEEDYPYRLYDLKKNLKVMIKSILYSNGSRFIRRHHGFGHTRRFNTYHKFGS